MTGLCGQSFRNAIRVKVDIEKQNRVMPVGIVQNRLISQLEVFSGERLHLKCLIGIMFISCDKDIITTLGFITLAHTNSDNLIW